MKKLTINTIFDNQHTICCMYFLSDNFLLNERKISNVIEKKLKLCGTARNWNTVIKLVEIGQSY